MGISRLFFLVTSSQKHTDNPLYTDTRYNDNIRYNDNLTIMKRSFKRKELATNYARILYLILLRNICFGYLLESPLWGDSNKYPKHMFNAEIRRKKKQDLSYISICSLSILYNGKFILMATSLGTNVVVVTRVHCMWWVLIRSASARRSSWVPILNVFCCFVLWRYQKVVIIWL